MTTNHAHRRTPAILIISGLDPSGGAGFIADVRVAERFGLRAVGVITAHTEQTTQGVRAVHPVPAEIVGDQLRALLADIEVSAIKIGMLATPAIAEAVARSLAAARPLAVWDPIVRPTAGRVPLYDGDPRELLALLGDHIGVITPNIPEAELLTGEPIRDVEAMARAARTLAQRLGEPAAALVKGGHLPGNEATDVIATVHTTVELAGEPIALGQPVHGTGCALSTALACELARMPEPDPVHAAPVAKRFVAERLAAPEWPGRGAPAIV